MKKKFRKNFQFTLTNYKGAGRPAIHDAGIRHTSRPELHRPCSLHLTVKIKKIKADIKNKTILHFLKRAILNSRKQGLKVIHFSLEYDHVHLLIEADNNIVLGKGMKSFGVTLSKAINKVKNQKGGVYKHRYHFRQISSARQLKNVMKYIFLNGVKHKTANNIVSPFNSISAEEKYFLFYKKAMKYDFDLMRLLDRAKIFYRELEFL
ncbi:MAG: transposase [Rhizobacter sp.]|nr:transposase [Bacteriovorax sp.]